MAEDKKVDEVSGVETTGHAWDGIQELNNPLPKWWVYCFYITIVWGIAYTVAYPAWPMISGATQGVLGYNSRVAVHEEIDAHRESQKVYVDRMAEMDVEEIAADQELMQFALAGGSALFKAHCSQCHGSGAQGGVGYPNLNDDSWIWGGTREDVYLTIAHGIRWAEDEDTRDSAMPAFGADEILEDEEIGQVVDYVLSISGQDHDADAAEAGAELFADNCASCHGAKGRGIWDLGAPNLTDAIWLYGGDRDTLTETIVYSRAGVMPSWLGRLTDAEVKQAALYAHALGGGLEVADAEKILEQREAEAEEAESN